MKKQLAALLILVLLSAGLFPRGAGSQVMALSEDAGRTASASLALRNGDSAMRNAPVPPAGSMDDGTPSPAQTDGGTSLHMQESVLVALREGAPLLRRIRESNDLSRRIFALKTELTALRDPLLATVRERVQHPDNLTGDQLISLRDTLRVLQGLRGDLRRLNLQLMDQRHVWRTSRLARDTEAMGPALEALILTQQAAVQALEGGLRVMNRLREAL